MNFRLLLLLTTLLGSSCREQPTADPTSAEVCPAGNTATTPTVGYQTISGSWEWVQSVRSNRGSVTHVDTPASTGQTRRFIFNADRTYQYIVDQRLSESGTYELQNFFNDPILMLQLHKAGQLASGGVLLTLCDAGLTFAGGAADGGANVSYVRLP